MHKGSEEFIFEKIQNICVKFKDISGLANSALCTFKMAIVYNFRFRGIQ